MVDFTMIECGRHRDELLLLACGDIGSSDCSQRLREHLSVCRACRESLDQTRETVAMLADALAPGILDVNLGHAVRPRIVRHSAAPSRQKRPAPLHAVGFGIAAGLILAFLMPVGGEPPIRLTYEEERELVSAYAMLQWSGPVEYAIERVNETIDEVDRAIERSSPDAGILPWQPDDDWDAPTIDDGRSLQSLPLRPNGLLDVCRLESAGRGVGTQTTRTGT
jgi:hypothetical protein